MAKLSREQRRVASEIQRRGRRRGASQKEILAAIETGLVETNLRNLPGGDRDSAGWRQERASLYPDPTNLGASIERFFDETARVKHKYARAGDLAAAVQRPAAQYRGRYQQRREDAVAILRLLGGGSSLSSASSGSAGSRLAESTRETLDQNAFKAAKGRQLLAQLFAKQGRGGNLIKLGVLDPAEPNPRDFMKSETVQIRVPSSSGGGAAAARGALNTSDLGRAVKSIEQLAGGIPITAKQEPGHASGGDHDPAVRGATARDFGGGEAERKAAFERIARELGVKGAVYKGRDLNVTKGGIRYQVISRDHGSGPHLHVGLRKVRRR